MSDLPGPKDPLGGTLSPGDFPIGSLQSRAAARVMLEARVQPPDMVISFVGAKVVIDDDGTERMTSVYPRVTKCTCNGIDYEALPGESTEDFAARVLALQPRDGMPSLAIMWGDEGEK